MPLTTEFNMFKKIAPGQGLLWHPGKEPRENLSEGTGERDERDTKRTKKTNLVKLKRDLSGLM